ncbi:hypothetical protein BGZ65_008441 [Modicella reniformis]|uniref:O-fucosyltransferase family protein n=1 Tax=Modicella reniformis TaxID=1440133 RepID=A0A9P6JLX1_9FUNG|nr:hypothetical protein BGZ65_008441 [Modicella reniformis]
MTQGGGGGGGEEDIITTTTTELVTVTQYANGTRNKEFKAKFFKNPFGARKEMGSFMETLAKRTWWVNSQTAQAHHDDGDDDGDDEGVPMAPTDAFFAYLPMGGSNNQFSSLQKAALLAKDLKRTLIIPPISPNSHIKVWSGPRYSEFFNLKTFSAKTGIPFLEWHDIKQTPDHPPEGRWGYHHGWTDFTEDFPCVPNAGIGVKNTQLYDHFRSQFLLKFKSWLPKGVKDSTKGKAVDYAFVRDVLLKDNHNDDVQTSENNKTKTKTQEEKSKPEMWKCLSCPYFLTGSNVTDRMWHEIGLYLRFNNKTERMVDEILDLLLPSGIKKKEEEEEEEEVSTLKHSRRRHHPEFIIVHLRRGDIVNKCKPGQDEKDCLVQIEEIAVKVEKIETERRDQNNARRSNNNESTMIPERLPVLVATNEKRPEELEKLNKLGWIVIDHGDEAETGSEPESDYHQDQGLHKTTRNKKLGTMTKLGPFYPPMLDAVLLTRGNYMIGMSNSRMSQLAALRGAAWYGHKTMLM